MRIKERNIVTDAIDNTSISYIDISRQVGRPDFRDLRELQLPASPDYIIKYNIIMER